MIRSTTVICVRHKGKTAMAADGQVTMGQTILKEKALPLSGTGDVVEPDDGLIAIGSGGPFALAAARALIRHTDLGAREIAEEALGIAAGICVYTNLETAAGARRVSFTLPGRVE